MSETNLEERVAELEKKVAELTKRQEAKSSSDSSDGPGPHDWKATIGMFRGDPIMKEICDEAMRLREEERRQFFEQESE